MNILSPHPITRGHVKAKTCILLSTGHLALLTNYDADPFLGHGFGLAVFAPVDRDNPLMLADEDFKDEIIDNTFTHEDLRDKHGRWILFWIVGQFFSFDGNPPGTETVAYAERQLTTIQDLRNCMKAAEEKQREREKALLMEALQSRQTAAPILATDLVDGLGQVASRVNSAYTQAEDIRAALVNVGMDLQTLIDKLSESPVVHISGGPQAE